MRLVLPIRIFLVAALVLGGCALVHERPALDAGGASDDAAVAVDAPPIDPCAGGRRAIAIPAPHARQPGFSILLQMPHASRDGARIATTAEVISDRQGGIGSSDVLTFDADGGGARAFFTTDLPYVLGTVPGLEEYLEAGGFHGTRVYGEIRRFADDYDAVVFGDGPASIHMPRPDATPSFSIFEVARDGDRAVRFDDHRGLVEYTVGDHAIVEDRAMRIAVQIVLPTPRLAPSGRVAAFRSGEDRTQLAVVDVATFAITTHPMGVEAKAIAFVDDAHVLILPRAPIDPAHPTLVVLSLDDDDVATIDVGLPPESSPYFEGLDVSAHGETLVVSAPGGGLDVIRCDPALRAALTR